MAVDKENEHRVLALAPNGRDARATCEILGSIGIAATICADMGDLCRQLEAGAGAVLLTSDSLVPDGAVAALATALRTQPQWSDLPVLLLASGGANSAIALEALEALSNVLVLDRPVHLPTLASAVRTALRSRERQYEIRNHLRERTQTEQALRESEERMQMALEVSRSFAFDWEPKTDRVTRSDRCGPILGLAGEEVRNETGEQFFKRLDPRDRDSFLRTLEELTPASDSYHRTYRLLREDGTSIVLEEFARAFFDADKKLSRLVGVTTDVTARARAQEVLRESEERFRTMADGLPLIVWVHDAEGEQKFVNRTFLEFFGLEKQDITNETWKALLHPEDAPDYGARFAECVRQRTSFRSEARVRRSDGEWRWIESYARPRFTDGGEFLGFVGASADITDRKQAEEAMRQRAEEIETLLEVVPAAVWVAKDPQCLEITGNRRANEFYEAEEGENVSASTLPGVRRFFSSDGRELGAEELPMQLAVATNQDVRDVELHVQRPSGRRMTMLGSASPLRNPAGQVRGGVAAFMDITARKKAEEALQESDERFRAIFESNSDCILVWDREYNYIYANQSAIDHVGATRDKVIGGNIRDGLGHFPDFMQLWMSRVDRAFATGEAFRVEDTADFGGRLIHSESQVCPIRDATGQIFAVGVVYRDVTERKRMEEALRESEEQFRAFFQNAAVGAAQLGLDKRFLEVNDRYCQITGFSHDELLRMTPDDLTHPDDRQEASEGLPTYLAGQGGEYHTEKRYIRKVGEVVWVEVTAGLVRDSAGRPLRSAEIIQDITERKRVELALKENDRRKDEFLAMLGHELRNPLAAITTGIRLLRSPDAERHEWVKESLDRQTRQLTGLVDDLLDISRITRGKIQLRSEVVDLARIAEGAAESAADLIAEKKHAFAISCAAGKLPVLGDPTRLQQIIANLLNNAAKYTMDGGRIDLTLTLEGNEAVVCVKDNGMGIPADMQESIFDLFGQVDSAMHRPQQGLGIGLNLVKMLVELHGGKVAVSSEGDGKGSQFTVRLPAVEWPKELENRGGSGESVEEEFFDVLVVEDNREAARMLGAVLAGKGHTVRMAENGLTALELAAERQPDLVVLDIGLPDITGYEVAEKLRQELGYDATLIIAATGYGQEKDRQRSRQAGIDHHLVKPVQYETLTLLAREWRRTARGRRQIVRPFFQAEAIDACPERSVRILVIDDTRAIARITQRMLQQEGHMVEVAFDGPSGIEAARSFRPALILCDLSLPGANGFEVLKAVRADPALDGVVVAALTGYSEDEDKQRTKQAGFDVHLVKPVSLEQLQALVRQLAN